MKSPQAADSRRRQCLFVSRREIPPQSGGRCYGCFQAHKQASLPSQTPSHGRGGSVRESGPFFPQRSSPPISDASRQKVNISKMFSSPKNLSCSETIPMPSPRKPHPHVGHGRLSETVFIDSSPTISRSCMRIGCQGKRGEGPGIPTMGSRTFTLWGCGIVSSYGRFLSNHIP